MAKKKIKLKHVTKDLTYIPDFKFETEEGEIVNNRELDPEDQIKIELTLADLEERSNYISVHTSIDAENNTVNGSDFRYKTCIKKHVKKVLGMEEVGIITADDLLKFAISPEINSLLQDLFLKINGVKEEDTLSPKK